MTTPAHAIEVGEHLPSEDVAVSAAQLRSAIERGLGDGNAVRLFASTEEACREEIVLAPDLSRLLIQVLGHFERGEGVTFVPISKRMTTQQAADILNVSRPFLIKILERGDIPFEKINRHRRILARDLFEYKRRRNDERKSALDELLEGDGDLY